MKKIAAASAGVLLGSVLWMTGCSGRIPPSAAPSQTASTNLGSRAATPAPKAGFDFYLLNLSWSPEYCHSHADATECADHDTFVLHGLWPENADGSYPQHCSNAPGPANPSQYNDLYPDPGLLQHEWQTHGTCSGLAPDAYFSLVRAAFHKVAVPSAFQSLSSQVAYSPQQIVGLFTAANPTLPATSVVVSCGNNYLTAVEACLDPQLNPVACGAVRSCRANSVRVPPPQ